MSEQKDTLGGLTAKDWSLIIVLFAIAFTFVIIGIGLAIAIASDASSIQFTGEFNLDSYTAALILLVGAGITMVTQQLSTKAAIASRKA